MAANLIDSLKGLLTPDLLTLISSRSGESESSVSKGLNAALPLIMGALLQKSNDESTMSQIMSLLTSRANTADVLANPKVLLGGDPSSTAHTDLGSSLLSTLFGSQLGSVTSALGEHAGLRSSSASSIMTLAASLITASLGDRVRREGLSSSGLMSLLGGQRDFIARMLPGALARVGGDGARCGAWRDEPPRGWGGCPGRRSRRWRCSRSPGPCCATPVCPRCQLRTSRRRWRARRRRRITWHAPPRMAPPSR